MGKKDITLKNYLSDTKRYADLLNGSIFQGKQMIRAEELQEVGTVQTKSDNNTVLERIQDIAMKQTKNGNLFAVWILANQEKIDFGMPVRIMLGEALEYDKQLKAIKKENKANGTVFDDAGEFLSKVKKKDRLNPVITLVVYWGEDEWQGARSLHDIIDFGDNAELAEEIKKLVPEYPLHFLNLSEIHDFSNYRTELKNLFELYDRRNDKQAFREYLKENKVCRQIDAETLHVVSVLTNITKLQDETTGEKEDTDMWKAIEDLIEDGRMEGRTEGLEQGRQSTLYELVQDGLITMKDASMKASMSEDAFSAEMKKAGY